MEYLLITFLFCNKFSVGGDIIHGIYSKNYVAYIELFYKDHVVIVNLDKNIIRELILFLSGLVLKIILLTYNKHYTLPFILITQQMG